MEAGRVDADEKLRACADSQFEIWLSGLIEEAAERSWGPIWWAHLWCAHQGIFALMRAQGPILIGCTADKRSHLRLATLPVGSVATTLRSLGSRRRLFSAIGGRAIGSLGAVVSAEANSALTACPAGKLKNFRNGKLSGVPRWPVESICGYGLVTVKLPPNNWFKSFASLTGTG